VTAVFWILAALFVVAALAFVLPALFAHGRSKAGATDEAANLAIYRDQLKELDTDLATGTLARQQYDEARRDLERRMLEDLRGGQATAPAQDAGRHGTAIVAGMAVPLLAALLYFAVGNPRAINPQAAVEQNVTREQIEGMVGRLAARMKEAPEDLKGWVMLGRSYAVLDRYPEAVEAYANAVKRSPPDAQLLADYADTMAMAQGHNLLGEPERLIAQALKIDPDNVKALLLAGTVALEKHDFNAAIAHWERILKLVPSDSDLAVSVRDGIDDARKLAGTGPKALPGKATPAPAAVSGTVRLAPAIVAKAAPGDTVFIFARAVNGPRIPLAVARKRVSDLPAAFTLDDSMAMSPAAKLSDHARVVIGARVSKSGNPVAQPGDLEGLSSPVDARTSGVTVVIDREIPAAK
jgi:cytochrome c-type biogenesis protein CcmH